MDLDFERDPAVLEGLIGDLGHGLFTIDADGHFVAWSRDATLLTGHRRADVEGKPCGVLDAAAPCFGGLTAFVQRPRDGALRFEGAILTRGQRELHVRGVARQVRSTDGAVLGAVGAFAEHAPEAPRPLQDDGAIDGLVGASEPMREVTRRVRLAAHSDVTTLIVGESGTGKELVARAVHDLSARSKHPFVAVNCAAIPETMLEGELFGHVKGAFTGAVRDRPGLIEAADGGTLFLDEIGDLSPMIQVKLLRVLQEREVRRLGADQQRKVDVRLVTATNRDLRQLLDDGAIREDFYYRIHVYEIATPPLRERLADIAPLVDWFVQQQNAATGRKLRGASQRAMRHLLEHDWPGNVRELRNAIEHAFVTAEGDRIEPGDLPEEVRTAPTASSPRAAPKGAPKAMTARDHDERARIVAELDRHDWNRSETASALGYSRVTLWKKMRRFGIDEGVFRRGG